MVIHNKFRYTFSNSLGLSYVVPLGEADFKIEWSRRDESRLDYLKEFPSKIVINDDFYGQLLSTETSADRCEFTYITVERPCNNDWVPWFFGRISLNNADWDLDRCTVTLKVEEIASDTCFDDNKSKKINLFSLVSPDLHRTVRILPNYAIDYIEYQQQITSPNPCKYPAPYFPGPSTAEAFGYAHYYHFWSDLINLNTGQHTCYRKTKWARYIVSLPINSPSPGAGWTLVDHDTVSLIDTWAKPVSTYDCKTTTEENPDPAYNIGVYQQETICKILGGDASISTIDNGIHLRDALTGMMAIVCPDLTVVSNFFQINPTVTSNINYVTGLASKVLNLVIFQKSDVKRPNSSGNATKAEITLDQLLEVLVTMFNVRWRISGSAFIIEHVSFFTKATGFDLTQAKYKRYTRGLRRYSYNSEKIPGREEFLFMEASAGDFAGLPIVYSGACVTKEGRSNVATYNAENFTTDIQLCLDNPGSDSRIVDDKGFVLMATYIDGIELKIISEPPILSPVASINNSLGWALLHRDYFRHYRPLRSGNMNGVNQTFFSIKPLKKGAPITIPLCCTDDFNPDDKIVTDLGTGIVDKASFSFRDEAITLDIFYEA